MSLSWPVFPEEGITPGTYSIGMPVIPIAGLTVVKGKIRTPAYHLTAVVQPGKRSLYADCFHPVSSVMGFFLLTIILGFSVIHSRVFVFARVHSYP